MTWGDGKKPPVGTSKLQVLLPFSILVLDAALSKTSRRPSTICGGLVFAHHRRLFNSFWTVTPKPSTHHRQRRE